ncbi:MAG TPA: hypothetical protein VG346_06055 [Acidimicrobiales bacterium]|nr:hypothetical protein [Acidimicrobiales bacterium]
MPSPPARRRAVGLLPIIILASGAVIAAQLATYGHPAAQQPRRSSDAVAAIDHSAKPGRPRQGTPTATAPTVPPTTSTTSTTSPPPPPGTTAAAPAQPAAATTTTTAPPPPAETPAVQPSPSNGVPPAGQATAWGCSAALSYLSAYAYPGFTFECPGDALGREAMTCADEPGICPNELLITIADACPAAYMNEASNSWVLMGKSTAPIDPYGTC